MALPKLVPADQQVQVQDTTFSIDALGRFICSTWQEATGNGGPPFSAVVIGAGMYARTARRSCIGSTRASGSCCSMPVVSSFPSTCRTWAGSVSTCLRRSPQLMTQAWHVPLCGGCRGAATSSFLGWLTAAAGSPCTGADGAQG
jgi:hypothetical protein